MSTPSAPSSKTGTGVRIGPKLDGPHRRLPVKTKAGGALSAFGFGWKVGRAIDRRTGASEKIGEFADRHVRAPDGLVSATDRIRRFARRLRGK